MQGWFSERTMVVLLFALACTSRPSSEGLTGADEDGSTSTEASVDSGAGTFADEGAGTTQRDHDTTTHDPGDATSSSGDPVDDGPATTTGEVVDCQLTVCQGKVYACGDCLDNDGDGRVDAADPGCWGPCDNNESGWYAEHPAPPGPTSIACTRRIATSTWIPAAAMTSVSGP